MKYPYAVKIDGVDYPANTEIPVPADNAEKTLDEMTKAELEAVAEERGISIIGLKKPEILALLKDNAEKTE